MKSTLLFQGVPIAQVEQDDADFPTYFGHYRLVDDSSADPVVARVREYHDFSVRTWPLIEQDRYDEVASQEEQFADLIESSDWSLLQPDGSSVAILIPVFCTNSEINWRLA